MSQIYKPSSSGGSGTVQFLQGNSGGDVGPNGSGEIFILGTGGVNVTGDSGTNTLTVSVSSEGISWTDESSDFSPQPNNGYFIYGNAPELTAILPSSPSQGDVVYFNVTSSAMFTIQANTGQYIRLATAISSEAGTCSNTQIGDTVTLFYRASSSTWQCQNFTGGWNIA